MFKCPFGKVDCIFRQHAGCTALKPNAKPFSADYKRCPFQVTTQQFGVNRRMYGGFKDEQQE